MRKVTFGCAVSLDNYIAREDDGVDWLSWTDEVAAITGKFWKTIDTVLMGRRTYEVALKSGTPAYPGMKNYVFSRILKPAVGSKVTIVSNDAVDFVRQLKQQKGKGICVMGGGRLGKTFLDAGLVDEVGVNVHPVLLGRGIPLFRRMDKQIDLELVESKALANGCVYSLYRVKST